MIKDILGLIPDVADRRFLIIGSVIAFCGIYLGVLFFGENSILTYFFLKNQKSELTNKIGELKNSNAVLQKQYFELSQQNRHKSDK